MALPARVSVRSRCVVSAAVDMLLEKENSMWTGISYHVCTVGTRWVSRVGCPGSVHVMVLTLGTLI